MPPPPTPPSAGAARAARARERLAGGLDDLVARLALEELGPLLPPVRRATLGRARARLKTLVRGPPRGGHEARFLGARAVLSRERAKEGWTKAIAANRPAL